MYGDVKNLASLSQINSLSANKIIERLDGLKRAWPADPAKMPTWDYKEAAIIINLDMMKGVRL